MRKTKVILIANMIGPYCVPLYNFISEQSNFDFMVVALTEREKNREWKFTTNKIKFEYQILPGRQWFFCGKKRELAIHFNTGVFRTLRQHNPDVVVTTGYESIAYWQSFLYSKLCNKKYVLWNGTTLFSTHSNKWLRGLLKTIIVRGADKYLAYGIKAKDYLEYFGAKREDVYITMNTVDVEYFRDEVSQHHCSNSFLQERKKYPKILLLSIGQLVKRKGIEQILKALASLDEPDIGLIILGSGPEEKRLQKFCADNNLANVFFEGFCQQEALPKYYALADIFILPSFEEVWGLVVNEALAGGLYTLCSKYAGVGYDLIKKDWNGNLFNPAKIEELTVLIKQAKKNIESIRSRRKEISSSTCKKFSIAKSGQSFLQMIASFEVSSTVPDRKLPKNQAVDFEKVDTR